jgi:hypothetical protein
MALNSLLEASPTDAEAWAELAEIYVTQGLYQQGIFALEEVLLITPNAWNVSAFERYKKPVIGNFANNLRI